MQLVPKREYLVLLAGDVLVFLVSLYLTLALRYLALPSFSLLYTFLVPFTLLFAVWIVVFFMAGVYGRYTRLFRRRLFATIFYTQVLNMLIAALFFFFVPVFGIAPKTILFMYLFVSFALIIGWRVLIFPHLPVGRKLRGILIASGPDAQALAQEIMSDGRYPFTLDSMVDTAMASKPEVIREALRAMENDNVAFLIVDFSDPTIAAAFPILYDAAFRKRRFALVDIVELYQEMFDAVPLSLVRYEWVLENVSTSRVYDGLKRALDLLAALLIGVASLAFYPFVALAIKLDDNGPLFITQTRVGRFQEPIKIIKFRTMSGNDQGVYTNGVSSLKITRAGKWLRFLRIDELPQIWNVLKGELSFVGPRPELPALASTYSARIPYYSARYLVAPGLSGWAQLRHDRDPHHGEAIEETREKLSYDLYYLKRRSLWLDLYVLLQTFRIVITARGS